MFLGFPPGSNRRFATVMTRGEKMNYDPPPPKKSVCCFVIALYNICLFKQLKLNAKPAFI